MEICNCTLSVHVVFCPSVLGSVSYSITSDDGNVFFRVHPHTGVLYVAKDLDHETVPWVLLNIQAQIGSPVSYGQAQVSYT